MNVTYEIINLHEAKDRNLPYWYAWEAATDGETDGAAVYRCEDGVPVEILGTDGGEPEDQSLHRDWSWVSKALQAAYDLGLAVGESDRP